MPIFTYNCQCGGSEPHTFEKFFFKTEDVPKRTLCPICSAWAKKIEFEVPSRRDPRHGIQT